MKNTCQKIFVFLMLIGFFTLGESTVLKNHAVTSNLSIGLKDIYRPIKLDDTIEVPVFIANYTDSVIERISFTLAFNSSEFNLIDWNLSKSIIKTWNLTANTQVSGECSFTLSKTTTTLGFTDGEIIRVRLKNKVNPINASSRFYLELKNVNILGLNSVERSASTQNGYISYASQYPLGDINKDWGRDQTDADSILKYVVGELTSSSVTLSNADLDQKGFVSSFDALLLSLHSVGRLSTIPLNTADNFGTHPITPILQLSSPVSKGNNIYEFTLTADTVANLLAAEFTIEFDSSVVTNLSLRANIGQRSMAGKFVKSKGVINIALTSNWPLYLKNKPIVTVTVQYNPSKITPNLSGFRFKRALFNEGRIQLNSLKYPYATSTQYWGQNNSVVPEMNSPIPGILGKPISTYGQSILFQELWSPILKYDNGVLVINNIGTRQNSLSILTPNGKVVDEVSFFTFNGKEHTLPINLHRGFYIIRLDSPNGKFTRKILIP